MVIAERTLDYFGDAGIEPGFVRLFAPFRHDEGYWRCDYHLSWPGYEYKFYAGGEDAWQALQCAMQIIPVHIAVSDAFKTGRIGWVGQPLNTEAELVRWFVPTSLDAQQ